MFRIYPDFQEFVEKIENRGKDVSMNSQNLPRFFKIHRSNGKSG